MLGEFITRVLILVFGYAYPAFECFKTMEKNRVEMQELRFWCQYWIIVAVLTVCERIIDMFVSWLPMYDEMKLALIIYLWYPKTKGSGYVYETLLRPYVSRREPDIDRNLRELSARLWDLALYYWQNCTSLGETKFFEIVQFLTSQFGKITKSNNETADQHLQKLANKLQQKNEKYNPTTTAPPSSPTGSPLLNLFSNKRKQSSDHRRRTPLPPPSPETLYRCMAQAPKSDVVQLHLHSQTGYIHIQNHEEPDPADSRSGSGHSMNQIPVSIAETVPSSGYPKDSIDEL